MLPGTTEDPPNKAFVKLPRAKLGGHRRSKHKAASASMASSVGSESLGFGRPQVGRPAPGDTRRFFRAVDAADCSDPASLRRLGISYPKTTVLKMELSFARLNPPADVDRDREPVPVVDPADLEKSMAASWRAIDVFDEEIASPGDDVPCKYPDCEGRECYKHHGYEGNAPRPFLQCHYTAATTVDCKITVAASLPDAEAWGVVRAYCAEVGAFKPAA